MTRARAASSVIALAAALASCRSDMSQGPAPGGAGAAPTGSQGDGRGSTGGQASAADGGRAGSTGGQAGQADGGQPASPGEPEDGRLAGITAAHNRVRAALDIAPLVWSPELAAYAGAWVEKLRRRGCALAHRPRSGPDAQRHGENIFSGSGFQPAAADVVEAWVSERADYDARTGRCRGVCGHYTQVVWRKSQRLGCAMAACGETEVWVCNYDPPGNFVGQRPY